MEFGFLRLGDHIFTKSGHWWSFDQYRTVKENADFYFIIQNTELEFGPSDLDRTTTIVPTA
jgi:hypothetical protein